MIRLAENSIRTFSLQSSKGNQLKWKQGEIWYKADYTGYEGLAESVQKHFYDTGSGRTGAVFDRTGRADDRTGKVRRVPRTAHDN